MNLNFQVHVSSISSQVCYLFLHAPLVIAKLINYDADELAVYPLRNEQHIDLLISTTLVGGSTQKMKETVQYLLSPSSGPTHGFESAQPS
jgi:hypothetical protein